MKDDLHLSNFFDIFKLVVWIISIVGPYVVVKTRYWTRKKTLNLIFGVALLVTNGLMVSLTVPTEAQIYSAAGQVWAPFTTPHPTASFPAPVTTPFANFINFLTMFLLIAGGGFGLGVVRLMVFKGIPPSTPPRQLGGAGIG